MLKATGNKWNICPLKLYLTVFNKSQLVFGKTSRNIFFFLSLFSGIVKLSCELRHKFLFNLWLWQTNNLRPLALLLRNLCSAAGRYSHSAVCGNTYAPPIFRLVTAFIKIHQIPHIIFGTNSQFFFKLCITLQCHET